jgi:hypothetical protein
MMTGETAELAELAERATAAHDLIGEAERLARLLRVVTGGRLSLAVVDLAVVAEDRAGMGWDDAHRAVGAHAGPHGRRGVTKR